MNKIKIITDCTSDLTTEMYEKLDIYVMLLNVTIGGKEYIDKVNITSEEMFKIVDEVNSLPKTSALTPSDFYNAFKTYVDKVMMCAMGLGAAFLQHIKYYDCRDEFLW